MGLPSKGLDYVVTRLRRRSVMVPLIINFNGVVLEDYLRCFDVLQPLGDALKIALFCPNRPRDVGNFLDPRVAETLLIEIAKRKRNRSS